MGYEGEGERNTGPISWDRPRTSLRLLQPGKLAPHGPVEFVERVNRNAIGTQRAKQFGQRVVPLVRRRAIDPITVGVRFRAVEDERLGGLEITKCESFTIVVEGARQGMPIVQVEATTRA
jgi:hypothetical protein